METVGYISSFHAVYAHQAQRQVSIRKELTCDLIALQEATPEQPYSIPHRLKLAKAYQQLGYPDLAASDAYKALLLIDEVVEEGEYYEEVLEAIERKEDMPLGDNEGAMKWAQTDCSRIAYVSNKSVQSRIIVTF
jgi:hypothetical protein